MLFGRIWACDRVQFRCQSDIQISGAVMPSVGGGTTLTTSWATSTSQTVDGIILSAFRKGTQPRGIRLQIPALNIDTGVLNGASGNGSIEALLEIDGLTYHLGGGYPPLWRVSWSAMRLYRDGTQVWSGGAGVYSDPLACQRVAPSGVPFLGIPAILSCGAQSLMQTAPMCSIQPPDTNIYPDAPSVTVTGTGGWRFRETSSSSWVELPVDCSVQTPPQSPCSLPTPVLAVPSATTTWNGQVSAAVGGTGGTAFEGYSRDCWVCLLPNLPKSFNLQTRLDYASLWVRGGFPKADAVGTYTGYACAGFNQVIQPCSDSSVAEIHPPQSRMLSTVVWIPTPDPNVRTPAQIEEPLTYATKAPYGLTATRYNVTVWQSNYSAVREARFPALSQTSEVLPYLRHQNEIAQYIDTWANPHWSYFYWFPPQIDDPEEPIHDWEWTIDGERVATDAYWVPLRTQWLHHPSLPENEKRRTRPVLLSAPLMEGPYGGFIKNQYVAGATTSWVGVCRFDVRTPAWAASLTPDSSSSPAWSSPDASLTFGATAVTIANNGSNNGDRTVYFDLGRRDSKPWMYAHGLKLLGFYWLSTQVNNVRLDLVGTDGQETLLYSGKTVPSTRTLPLGAQTKHAGSWAQDYGMGQILDQGVDQGPTGMSASLMGSQEFSGNFRLGKVRSYDRLKITVSPIAPSQSVLFNYPVHYRASSGWGIYAENGSQQTVVWPDGGMMRFGQTMWWDASTQTVRQTPLTSPGPGSAYVGYGYKQSVLDGLCDSLEVFEGKDRLDGLAFLISTLYDSVETGGASGNALYGQADDRTLCWWHPAGFASPSLFLGNCWREIPPLAVLPLKQRDVNLLSSGDWVLETFDWAIEPKYLISNADKPASLCRPASSTDVTTVVSPGVSGWSIRRHTIPLYNDEKNWRIMDGGKVRALVRPWWGWVSAFPDAPPGKPSVCLDRHLSYGWRGIVLQKDGTVKSKFNELPSMRTWSDWLTVDGEADPESDCALAFHRGIVEVLYQTASGVKSRKSTDFGSTWGYEKTMFSGGRQPKIAVSEKGFVVRTAFFPDSGTSGPGTLKVSTEIPLGSPPSPEQTVLVAGSTALQIEDAGYDIAFCEDLVLLVCTVAGESEVSVWYSTDMLRTVKRV